MRIDVLTIFPGMFQSYFEEGLLKKAMDSGLFVLKVHDLREYATDRHRSTDDYPYGGGQGMVMKIEPIARAVEAVRAEVGDGYVLLLSPQGELFSHGIARHLASLRSIILICGRYEGVDERVALNLADQEISIGNYILTGGELPAMVVVDAVARMIPGVLGDEASATGDSFSDGILKYPQYTRPARFRGLDVPQLLLSGDHVRISQWRRRESLRRTLLRRPELIRRAGLTAEDMSILDELKREEGIL